MSLAAKLAAEARAEREADGYDGRWVTVDGNVVPYRGTASDAPIISAEGRARLSPAERASVRHLTFRLTTGR